jgi:hypothetical protein
VKFENECNNLICALTIIFSKKFSMEKPIKWTKIYMDFKEQIDSKYVKMSTKNCNKYIVWQYLTFWQ